MESNQSLSKFRARLYRVGLVFASTGLLLSLISFCFPTVPVGFLCFYFPFAWLVWILCVLAGPLNNFLRLLVIWSVIDLSILAMFLSITSSVGDVRGSQGTELVWFLSYCPVIFPSGIALAPFVTASEPLLKFFEAWFGSSFGGLLYDWSVATAIAFVQSLLLVSLTTSAQQFYRWRRTSRA